MHSVLEPPYDHVALRVCFKYDTEYVCSISGSRQYESNSLLLLFYSRDIYYKGYLVSSPVVIQ